VPALQQRNLEYQKMSDAVADTLQQMIVEDELKSGQKVTQDEVAKMLGVSTMPVREALLKLAALGRHQLDRERPPRLVLDAVRPDR
jgi:DNA-binding GntR family transcriptional regulator